MIKVDTRIELDLFDKISQLTLNHYEGNFSRCLRACIREGSGNIQRQAESFNRLMKENKPDA